MLIGALVLVVSLFLTWSHQLSPALAAQAGAAVASVPRDPTAWQVYSAADVLLAILAAALVLVAFAGSRRARLVLLLPIGVALAFVVHAMGTPPTNGLNLPSLAASPAHPTAGPGELVAVIGMGLAVAGVALSLTTD